MPRAPADEPLDGRRQAVGVRDLARRDPALRRLVERNGLPPMWARRPGFATLVRIVLEQQVTVASGAAAYARLRGGISRITPRNVLETSPARIRRLGITRQKTRYLHALAGAVDGGALDLRALAASPDADVRDALTQVTGIGRWTADVYLLMALRRPDAWPRGDVALRTVMRRTLELDAPGDVLDDHADAWRPVRAVAARILWHEVLSARARRRPRARSGG